jgi:ornithine cyclodeaminase/alanine dehydrogenase-like protein (mu-crystallin family)
VRTGEINVPIKEGSYRVERVYGTIGEVVAGLKPGRVDSEEITVVDSTGVGVQDAVAADYAYRQARSLGIGTWVEI